MPPPCQPPPAPGRARAPALAVFLLLAFAAQPPATGQHVAFALAGGAGPGSGAEALLAFDGVRVEDTEVGLEVAAGSLLRLGLDLRRSTPLGPAGTLLIDLSGDATSAGDAQLRLGARGVLGPVAVRAAAEAFTAPPARFDRLAGVGPDARPDAEAGGVGLALGGDYRADRDLIVGVDARLDLVGGALGARLDGRLTATRLLGADDAAALVQGYLAPGALGAHAAFGVGYTINRRRAPSWQLSAWLGGGSAGVWPGVRIEGGERLDGGGQLALALALEPYRLDLAPYRARLEVRHPLARPGSEGEIALVAALLAGRGPAAVSVRLGYRLPFAP